MSEYISFVGSYYEEIKESKKDCLKKLGELFLNKQDPIVITEVEKHFSDSDVNTSKLTFHEGANHVEWKKNGKDYFVIERHHN